MNERTYTIHITLGVGDHADEHLCDVFAVESEVRSWLESLGTTVRQVVVQEESDERLNEEPPA